MVQETPWNRYDYRKDSLKTILDGLNSAIDAVESKVETIHWYDGLWAREEVEPIIGLGFIATQNYINKSIADYCNTYEVTISKDKFYKSHSNYETTGRTQIELIVALANYAKHEEEGQLRKHTSEILGDFNLQHLNITIDDSPLIMGFELIGIGGNMTALYDIATSWREAFWQSRLFQTN